MKSNTIDIYHEILKNLELSKAESWAFPFRCLKIQPIPTPGPALLLILSFFNDILL
jgi:hypothetical protein